MRSEEEPKLCAITSMTGESEHVVEDEDVSFYLGAGGPRPVRALPAAVGGRGTVGNLIHMATSISAQSASHALGGSRA
eukprot:1524758-Pyramimonas_sp.AAC.1